MLELKQNKHISEAQLIKDLNFESINSKSLSKVEHKLEIYYSQYRHATDEQDKEKIKLDLTLNTADEDRRSLVNYLVHLESIAALVNGNILRLKVINELMAYRFFIALNNPVVQEIELKPYKNFYGGCYELHKKWTNQMQKIQKKKKMKSGVLIPMEEYGVLLYEEPEEKEPLFETSSKTILEHIKWFYENKIPASNPTAYFYDLTAIRANIKSVRQGMPKPVKIYYAMKANPNKDVMQCICDSNLIEGIEIASAGELNLALNYYKSANNIFTGPGKTEYELEEAIKNNIKYINIESVTEAYRVNEIATRLKSPM